MRDTLLFLGRFHVLVLHLPLGILVATVALDWAASRARYAQLRPTLSFMWGSTAVSAVATAALGYLHLAEGGFDESAAGAHRLFGTAFAVLAMLVWWLAARRPAAYMRAHWAAGVATLALAIVTGHYGGNLTHGSTFLFGRAPAPARELAGAEPLSPAAARPDPAAVAGLVGAGFLARPVAQSDPHLVVGVHSPGSAVERAQLDALLDAAAHVVELDLRDADLEDGDLAGFERFDSLTHLRLARNRLTDESIAHLAALPKLRSLNLYGNARITDGALERLAGMTALRTLYVWGTRVTAQGAARLRERRPDIDVVLGADAVGEAN